MVCDFAVAWSSIHEAKRGRDEARHFEIIISKLERKGEMEMEKPTHEQAQLHLQIYEMRRENRLRQGRDWFFKNYVVENLDDAMRIAAPGTEGGALAGMVLSYWEPACEFLHYRLLHDHLYLATHCELI